MGEKNIDAGLIKRAKAGNKAAFDTLVIKYQRKVAAIVSRYVDDPNTVLDITQDVFLKTYRAIEQFQGNSAFYTWLYRIAINTTKNYLKVKSKQPYSISLDVGNAMELMPGKYRLREYSSPEHIVACDEMQQAVIYAVESLPDDLRDSLLLRERDGLSYDEIAEVMHCPVGTVRSRIFRARAMVDDEIKPYLNG